MFRFFDHTGDIGVDIAAESAEGIFEEGAKALFEAIADTSKVRDRVEREISAEGEDLAEVLNRFLQELLVLFDSEKLLLPHVHVQKLAPRFVRAIASGEKFDPARHEGRTELKAVTWHELSVKKEPDGWKARVVFDV